MASTSQKKTTKKTSGKSGSRTTAKKPQPRPIRREVGGVVCLVLALCVFVSYFGISAIFIDWLAVLIKGLLGYGYWLFGPALVLAGCILLFHHGRPVTLRVTSALLLPVLFGLDGVLYPMPVSDVLTFVISAFIIAKTYKELNTEGVDRI